MRRRWALAAVALLAACGSGTRSSMVIERYSRPLGTTGPDAVALPVHERYRFGVVLGSVLTNAGERGCDGEVWLWPDGAPVRDVRSIADRRLHNMFRFPQLLPGRYELGVRCFGFEPVKKKVDVRIGEIVRAVVTMAPRRNNAKSEGKK